MVNLLKHQLLNLYQQAPHTAERLRTGCCGQGVVVWMMFMLLNFVVILYQYAQDKSKVQLKLTPMLTQMSGGLGQHSIELSMAPAGLSEEEQAGMSYRVCKCHDAVLLLCDCLSLKQSSSSK